MAASPSFGDRVRIAHSQETQHGGFAGRVGSVFGESIPSSSGVGPVIGDRGEDLALSIFFDDTEEQEWFAPHLVELIDHGGAQTMELDGGSAFVRAADGTWREVSEESAAGQSFLRALSEPIAPASAKSKSRRSWFRLRG